MREAALTDEPKYEGEPILAVAAVDENDRGGRGGGNPGGPGSAPLRAGPA